ncbi:integrase core domain-containing protein [Streptomyces cadmiisoli]|uniref:integrase core domain-containing protein n=1 Tax=Streptomyces cadmiisoli TaxID=2184053 RepID=UPI003667314F
MRDRILGDKQKVCTILHRNATRLAKFRLEREHTSFALAEHLDRAGIAASIGSVGDAYDNALMESTIGLFKTELIKPRRPWKTLSEVELATAEWIDWYCHRRLHGEIGYIPPAEYETNYYLKTAKPQVTVTT